MRPRVKQIFFMCCVRSKGFDIIGQKPMSCRLQPPRRLTMTSIVQPFSPHLNPHTCKDPHPLSLFTALALTRKRASRTRGAPSCRWPPSC